jgi:aminoglycoside/choline kinase family phosphotransferase
MRLPTAPHEISAPWLSEALGSRVDSAVVEDVIPGAATKVRVRLGSDRTVIVKAPMSGAEQDPATLSFFALEVAFYRTVAALLDVGSPRCLYAEARQAEGQALVILEDLQGAHFYTAGDTMSREEAESALAVIARLHATTWGHPVIEETPVYPGPMRRVLEGMLGGRYWAGCLSRPRAAAIPAPLREPGALLHAVRTLWTRDAADAHCLVHGDAHVGNVYRDRSGGFGLIDWQMSLRGHWCHDVAYFLASALDPADRAAHERAMLDAYRTRLASYGGPALDPGAAWDSYRRHMVHGLFWATNADGMYPEAVNTEVVARFGRAVTELDSLSLL